MALLVVCPLFSAALINDSLSLLTFAASFTAFLIDLAILFYFIVFVTDSIKCSAVVFTISNDPIVMLIINIKMLIGNRNIAIASDIIIMKELERFVVLIISLAIAIFLFPINILILIINITIGSLEIVKTTAEHFMESVTKTIK
jgi:hypothetical protein